MNDRPGLDGEALPPGLMSEREAAEWLHLSIKSLFNLRRKGLLSFVRIGTRVFYKLAHLQAFVEERVEDHRDIRPSVHDMI